MALDDMGSFFGSFTVCPETVGPARPIPGKVDTSGETTDLVYAGRPMVEQKNTESTKGISKE